MNSILLNVENLIKLKAKLTRNERGQVMQELFPRETSCNEMSYAIE